MRNDENPKAARFTRLIRLLAASVGPFEAPDPIERVLLTKAEERLEDSGREKLVGLLRAGDPRGEVATTWHAKEAVRELYAHGDEATAREWIERLIVDMADRDNPIEVRSLGRTLARWRDQIVAWHRSHV